MSTAAVKGAKVRTKNCCGPLHQCGSHFELPKGTESRSSFDLIAFRLLLPAYLKCFFKSLFHFEERANFSCPSCFNERRRTIPSLHSAALVECVVVKGPKKRDWSSAMSVQKSPSTNEMWDLKVKAPIILSSKESLSDQTDVLSLHLILSLISATKCGVVVLSDDICFDEQFATLSKVYL